MRIDFISDSKKMIISGILEDIKKLQLDTCKKDAYNHGLYNGIELARVTLLKTYKSKFLGKDEFKIK